jgi:small subunit ribosomal protein S4
MHGWRRGRPSDYAVRLREKQKCKRYYGVLETQFRRYFEVAQKGSGNTGANLLRLLERRLDNVLTAAGLTLSRAQARQMISHGHIQVNGRKVDVANYLVSEGDVVRPEPTDATLDAIRAQREEAGHREPGWLAVNDADLTVRVTRMPVREDVGLEVEDGLVVEFCSR